MPDALSTTTGPVIILASESPQRKAILDELGIQFRAMPMDVDEVTLDTPEATVLENAKLKAVTALSLVEDGSIVIAADTVLFSQGRILGKPKDKRTAREYLLMLSGQSVRAYSAVAVMRKGYGEGVLAQESAEAHIKSLSESEIAWYVETEEPLSRAGAFGIGRYGEIFVERIEGAHSCIAGLPKTALLAALAALSVPCSCAMPVSPPKDIVATRVQMHRFLVPA
jgi:septum formation protein